MKIHLISDHHLESNYRYEGDVFPEPPKCDVIIVGGDLVPLEHGYDKAKAYFTYLKGFADHVIYILGNHEMYHSQWEYTIHLAKQLAKETKVHFLDVESDPRLVIDGVKFWGSTLWTDLNNNDYRTAESVTNGLDDYISIKKGNRVLNTTDTFEQYQKTSMSIDWSSDVIISHHSPIYIKHRKFDYSATAHGFYCFDRTLENKIVESSVKYWLFAHTHDNVRVDLNGTTVISNCFGYKNEKGVIFDPHLILEL
jgi:predicted MPP superfamily phosphohydrolase